MAKIDASRLSTSRRLYSSMSSALCSGFEDACYEHIPLVNSGEDNQIIQLKRMLIKARSHTAHDCSKLFSADISQVKNCELLIVAYFTRGLRCTHTPRLST